MYRFCLSFYYFFCLFLKQRRYDIVFYYPQHFNRGKKGENYFFKHYYKVCKEKKLSYIIFEEPYSGSVRNKETIPFDLIFFLIVILRKLFCNQDILEKDRRIGKFLAATIFRNIEFKNFIVLSKSMLSVFSAIQPSCRIFDNQHGIIYPNKSDYFKSEGVSKHLVKNDVYLLIFGDEFRNILIKEDSTDFMKANSYIIGSPPLLNNVNHRAFNNNVLVTLQFTHDHNTDENLKLLEELHNCIHSASNNITFHLKHHPRFNNEVDLSETLKLSNVKLAPNHINDCFKICSLHVTAYSTSTFESALLGIPTILINGSQFNFFERDFNYPLQYSIADFHDNIIYKRGSVIVKQWAKQFYQPFCEESFLKVLKNV